MADDKLALEFGKALAESVDTSELQDLHNNLKAFLDVLGESEEFCRSKPEDIDLFAILCHENVEIGVRRQILEDVLKEIGAGETLKGFLNVLLSSNHFHVLREAANIFQDRVYKAHGKVRVELVFSEEPGKDTLDRIQSIVSRLTGREPNFEIRMDPAIIGGTIIRFEDTMLDLSVQGSLKRIKHAITR